MNSTQLFIGIDCGTQSMRAAAVSPEGLLVAEAKIPFTINLAIAEQSPGMWWTALLTCLQELTAQLDKLSLVQGITALSVTSTSGTVIPLDRSYAPLHAALMYNDSRSKEEAKLCSISAEQYDPHYPVKFNFSYGLPKMVWFNLTYPNKADKIRLWSHAGDFLIGRLTGVWGITDATNSLKTGYNLELGNWPDYISSRLSLPVSCLPKVVNSGTIIGNLREGLTQLLGWPKAVKVTAGMTDGCASQVASGAVKPGEWNTTIGTTMVIKGVTRKRLEDPLGRLYNHHHPQGYWMPGGASNTGADWITHDFPDEDIPQLNKEAAKQIPTQVLSYPLKQAGERFPFLSPQAVGFAAPGMRKEQLFAANLEGVAYIERLSYELIESLSGEEVAAVYTAGGGSQSETWLRIRSNVLNKPIIRAKHPEGAVGAAVIAASRTSYSSLIEAAEHMILQESLHEPDSLVTPYDENYRRFVELLQAKGYM